MKKLIYLCSLMLLTASLSSFTVPKPEKTILSKHQISHDAGYFDKNGNTYNVWVDENGFITSVTIVNNISLSVTSFSGSLNGLGVLRVDVTLSNSTSFHYQGGTYF